MAQYGGLIWSLPPPGPHTPDAYDYHDVDNEHDEGNGAESGDNNL